MEFGQKLPEMWTLRRLKNILSMHNKFIHQAALHRFSEFVRIFSFSANVDRDCRTWFHALRLRMEWTLLFTVEQSVQTVYQLGCSTFQQFGTFRRKNCRLVCLFHHLQVPYRTGLVGILSFWCAVLEPFFERRLEVTVFHQFIAPSD